MKDHPELQTGRRQFIISIKDNNFGNELSARLICNTTVSIMQLLEKARVGPRQLKAHKVCAVAASLQLFSRIDLHTVLKTDRCLSRNLHFVQLERPLSLNRATTNQLKLDYFIIHLK